MQEEFQRRHACDPAPLFLCSKLVILLGIILQEEDHPDSLGRISEALLWTFFTSSSLFWAILRMASRSPKFIVPVGQVLTQDGSIPSLTRSKHIVHLAMPPVFSSCRGMSKGQISRISLKSSGDTFTEGLKMTARVLASWRIAPFAFRSAASLQRG